ncbi:unnamed protein product [Heterobilharzia americana]|nr:unnamed protein product [Heterobilharzia americana]
MGDQKITEHFRIDDATGLIQSDGNLDRETFDHYEFIVIAQDCGIPSLSNSITVKVIMRDYNDELPTFTKQVYEFHVTENNQPNQYVGSITCSDGDLGSNGLIHFQIESMFYHGQVHHINDYHISPAQLLKTSNNVDDMFMNTSIKPELPFELLSYFDALRNIYLVKIYAKDKIDREELLVISESMPVSASSPISPSFSVSSHSLTQKVYKENMKPSKTSDNMDNVGYKFWIVGEDQGQPQQRGRALVHVIVDDQNDNRPYFKQPKDDTFLIDLSYMERMKYPVYKVIAVDDDAGRNGTVRYEIQRVTAEIITGNVISHHVSTVQNPNYEVLSTSLFSLNPVSGILRLNKQFSPSDIDRILNVDIKAYDLGIPDSKHSYISLRIRLINSTSSESKDGFKFLIDEEEDEEEDEDGRESYTKWWSHLRLSMNSYIILLTVTASILLSIILMCIIGFLIKRKRVKQDSNKNRSNDSNGPVKYNPSGLLLADRYKDIDNSPIKSKLIPDDNLDSINSTMSNLLNEVPNNEITSDNITHTISYSPINYGTSVLHYADNHYNICSLSSPFSSDSQTTVLPQPFIVRLEPISTSIMDTNCIQPISILYPTHSTENFDQLLIHPISNAPGLTSPCFSYSSNINSIKRSKQSCCELNNPPNRVTTDIQARYDQTARNLQFPKEEIHLDQLCNYNTNSLSKPKTPEIQHVCFHSPLTKRHSLNSLGQDSGNGDSLETTTVSLVPTTRSVWVDGSMNVSSVEISNKQPVSLSFVHVITPLSSVKETDNCNNNTNSSDTATSLNTLWYVK